MDLNLAKPEPAPALWSTPDGVDDVLLPALAETLPLVTAVDEDESLLQSAPLSPCRWKASVQ
jgi:hypothetical protein